MTLLSAPVQPALARAELVDVARRLAEREIAPRAAVLDGDPADPAADAAAADARAACLRRLAETGLDCALLPEDMGGAGLSADDLLAVLEEIALADGGVALSLLLGNVARYAIGAESTSAAALAPTGPWSNLVIAGGEVSGRIGCALAAWQARELVLLVPDRAPVVIAVDDAGVTIERDRAQLGLRGAPAAAVTLRDVPARELAASSAELLAFVRTGVAAIAQGVSRRAYRMALDYAEQRLQSGVPIVEHEAVADMLAAMAVRLCGHLPAAGSGAQALAAKIAATEAATATTRDAVQVFGGNGYMIDTGVEKLMRDAKYCQLFPEPNWLAAQELLSYERR